ncbi:hypothetical protein SMICM304S_05052 [Streptomyces microflavus]
MNHPPRPETLLRPRVPSPLQEVRDDRFSRRRITLLLKRDDLIHPDLPGNKWRELALNLEAAAGRTLLTFGGAYSNHLRATAAAGRLLGFPTIGVVRGDELAHRPSTPRSPGAPPTACGCTSWTVRPGRRPHPRSWRGC